MLSNSSTLTADGVKVLSHLNAAPLLRSHRISAMYPAPTSNIRPFASAPSGWVIARTKGATNSGYRRGHEIRSGIIKRLGRTFRFASISGGMMVSVIAEAAIYRRRVRAQLTLNEKRRTGATTMALMPYRRPSAASAFVNPTRPILAAL